MRPNDAGDCLSLSYYSTLGYNTLNTSEWFLNAQILGEEQRNVHVHEKSGLGADHGYHPRYALADAVESVWF